MRSFRTMAAIAALVGFFFWEQSLHAQADFYKGKRSP